MVVEHPVLVAKRAAARERVRLWQQNNPEKYKALRERRREADAELHRKWLARNAGYHAQAAAQYRAKHPDRSKAAQARAVEKNQDHYKEYKRRWYLKNRSRTAEVQRKRYQDNRDAVNQRFLERRRSDPCFRLRTNLRTRLNQAVRSNQKAGSAVRDLGCSIAALKAQLEAQWQAGWSWDNYGTAWVIDHYFPLARADLLDRAELLAVCNHRNLRAISWEENQAKGDSVCAEAHRLFDHLKRTLAAD